MSNKVTKQKSDRPYNIKRLGRKLKDKELLDAKDEIAELISKRLREDIERLPRLLRSTEHNHTFERDHDDTQA